MGPFRPRRTLAAVLAAGLAAGGRALAQEAIPEEEAVRRPEPGFLEGGGVKVADGIILHPNFELATAYQNNVFFQDANDPGYVGSVLTRLGVGGMLGTPGAGGRPGAENGGGASARLSWNAEGKLTWNQYISSNDAVTGQSDLGVGLSGGARFNPDGPYSLGVRDSFVRSVVPGQNIVEDQDRDRNELGLDAVLKPGGGALQVFFDYTFVIDVFESSRLSFDDRFSHAFKLGGRWQWLPQTQITADASLGIVSVSDPTFKPGSNPLRVWAGIDTLFTPVLGATVRLGYGNAFYDAGPSFSSYLAQTEVRYAIGPTIRVAGGYGHDFADALIGNYYSDHTFFARFGMLFGGRWQARAKTELRLRSYAGITDQPGIEYCGDSSCGNDRFDLVIRLDGSLDYQVNAWLFAGAAYSLNSIGTRFFIRDADGQIDYSRFVWNELLVRVQAKF